MRWINQYVQRGMLLERAACNIILLIHIRQPVYHKIAVSECICGISDYMISRFIITNQSQIINEIISIIYKKEFFF